MATPHLRKTFHYPSDPSSDEETLSPSLSSREQEVLIAKLRHENSERNDEYIPTTKTQRILLAIPLIASTLYLPALLTSRLPAVYLLSLLSMTSLLTTAYTLLFIPASAPLTQNQNQKQQQQQPTTPVEKYLPSMNGLLTLILALNSIGFKDRRGVHEGFWVLCFAPGG
ncbi:hypothetical protein MMC12_006263 [Toensbergia leucococca]|nr:hypothetical protein [Toensbergia leucococca]